MLFSDRIYGEALIEAYEPFGDIVKDIKRDLTGKLEKAILAMWGLEWSILLLLFHWKKVHAIANLV